MKPIVILLDAPAVSTLFNKDILQFHMRMKGFVKQVEAINNIESHSSRCLLPLR